MATALTSPALISAAAKILLASVVVVTDGRAHTSKRDAVVRKLRAAIPAMDVGEALDLAGGVVTWNRKGRG